jgi:putative two-component system response regulator
LKILIADDNRFFRLATRALLQEWEYEVVEAHDGVTAWQILNSAESPKMAILDWMMPGLSGLELCRKVRNLHRPEPTYVVMLTALPDKEHAVRALQAGADDFIHKPFDREELRARLEVGKRIVGLQTGLTIVYSLAQAVEAKCPYTRGHSERVMLYALALASKVGMGEKDRDILRRGALLHDIGKIGVPDSILNKQGKLTPEETAIVQEHPVIGDKIVRPLHSLSDLLPLIRWHHERLDGKGYPDGLRGDEIPFMVQLLSVADVYDALSSARPYRAAMSHGESLETMRKDVASGGLDLDLVEIFGAMPEEKVKWLAAKVKNAPVPEAFGGEPEATAEAPLVTHRAS